MQLLPQRTALVHRGGGFTPRVAPSLLRTRCRAAPEQRSVGLVQQTNPVAVKPVDGRASVASVDGDAAWDVPVPSGASSSTTSAPPSWGPLAWWHAIEIRQRLVFWLALSFVLSNMDKTNFTVAIIPMAMTYGWSPTVAGLVQSAFFWGFLLMQLPGGMLATKLGGAYTLPRGVALWSAATAAIPLAAGGMPSLCLTRALTGVGEAVAPSSVIDVLARTVPAKERASAVSFTFSGLHVGSIIGLLASPAIIQAWGWPALFYTFGLAGGLWWAGFRSIMDEVRVRDPELASQLIHLHGPVGTMARSTATAASPSLGPTGTIAIRRQPSAEVAQPEMPPIPYRAFLRSDPVRVLMFTHFCHNWFHYTMLSWLPTYFTSTLSVDLMHAAQTALLPPMAGVVASTVAGRLSDYLIARGMPLTTVRKLAQTTAFLVPTACLGAAATLQVTPEDSNTVVACITAALGMSSFSLAGLYCTHGDLSPKYASALLGLTNVAGSLPGIIGVATVGFLYDQTHEWSTALFLPSAFLLLAGAGVYGFLGSNAVIDFDAADNSPFPVERAIKSWWTTHPAGQGARRVTNGARAAWGRLSRSVSKVVVGQPQRSESGAESRNTDSRRL